MTDIGFSPDATPRDTTPRDDPNGSGASDATTKLSIDSPGVSPRGGGEEVAHAVVAGGIHKIQSIPENNLVVQAAQWEKDDW